MKLTYEQLDSNMSLDPYSIVKLNYPPLYTKIVAFSSTIDLTQDETKIRFNIEKFIMEKAAKLILNLAGRTMSCDFCNNSAKERDEAIKQRDEAVNELDDVSDVMIALYRKLAAGLESKEKQATPLPPHEFKETTQQYYVKWMNNPIIKDIKFKAVDDDAV